MAWEKVWPLERRQLSKHVLEISVPVIDLNLEWRIANRLQKQGYKLIHTNRDIDTKTAVMRFQRNDV